jgi:ABC-2 type transport system permease protein
MSQPRHAAWTKLRTVAGTGWLALATIAVTGALHAAAQEAAR